MYHDLDLYGNDNSKGEPIIHFDEDAIKSAFTTWLTSKRGDFLKDPTAGGIFDFSLFKKMNNETIDILTHKIKTAIINDFSPSITLLGLSLTPDYTHRLWIIEISYRNHLTNSTQTIQIFTKDLSKKEIKEYLIINYTELNLRNWVIIMKPSMKGKLLIFNIEKDSWSWGKYLLTEFSYSDPYFSEILQLINTGD